MHHFVVTLSKHRIFGQLLYPYFAEQMPGEPYLRLIRRVRQRDLEDSSLLLSAVEVRVVKISEKYSDESLIRKFAPTNLSGICNC